jgi:hypothetical protein
MHVRTILRRSAACKLGRPGTTLKTILWFYLMILFKGVPPKTGCGTNAKTLAGNSKTEPAQSS